MKKCFASLTGALILLLTVSGIALAAPAVPEAPLATASGQPDAAPYTTYGYYLTFDGDRIHLRTTDHSSNHNDGSEYTGVVVANGPIRDPQLLQDENDDSAVASGNQLDFRFRTYNGVDGVSFTAHDATRITFHLYRNGHLIETEHVFLGAARVNPPGNPFTLVV